MNSRTSESTANTVNETNDQTQNFSLLRMFQIGEKNANRSTGGGSVMSLGSDTSGWGSEKSRKSYVCLTNLSSHHEHNQLRKQAEQIADEGWGYFVDTTDVNDINRA